MGRTALLLASMALVMLLVSGVALALPSETPDQTPMVDGPVRTIEQVGTNVWVGGNFAQVKQRDGTVVADVQDVAVFDSVTGRYVDKAPRLRGNVRDIDVYGTNVVIGGTFAGPTSTQKNLVVVDGATGRVVQWYNSPALQSVLAVPTLGTQGGIYGGGVSLSAFDVPAAPTPTVMPLWTRGTTTFTPAPNHTTPPGYRDLELDGQTIWAACACGTIDGRPARALAKFDTAGNHDAGWVAEAGSTAFGISVLETNGALYLGAGGPDFLGEYRKASRGDRTWRRDTSGSTQAVEEMDGGLVIGGHFLEVADQESDDCGFRSSNDAATLDPNDVCQTRKGLAAYSFGGALDPGWDPVVSGQYNLVWALNPDGAALHFGGEFTKVSGIKQTFYARLS